MIKSKYGAYRDIRSAFSNLTLPSLKSYSCLESSDDIKTHMLQPRESFPALLAVQDVERVDDNFSWKLKNFKVP